jgi:hypothetical protein
MNTLNTNSALNIAAGVKFDSSITRIRYQPYLPLASTSYKNNDEVSFQVQNQDHYTLPSASYLIIEGKLVRAPATAAGTSGSSDAKAASDAKFIAKNAFAFLFEECRYMLNSIVVDRTRHLGYATLMKGLASLTKDEATVYQDAGWDEAIHTNAHVEGANVHFNACLPLKLLLGFAEDHTKIICGIRQDLVLTRANTDRNVIHATAAGNAENSRIEISKITWMLPTIEVSDTARIPLLQIVKRDQPLYLAFRSWEMYENPALTAGSTNVNWSIASTKQLEKPRFVIVGFQTKRKNLYSAENDKFDHLDVRDIKLFLNSEFYPYYNANIDFSKRQVAFLYQMYANFQKTYYNRDFTSPIINHGDFCRHYPLFVFDTSRQNDRIRDNASVDVRLEIETSKAIPADTVCYCLVLHDKLVEYTPSTNIVHVL